MSCYLVIPFSLMSAFEKEIKHVTGHVLLAEAEVLSVMACFDPPYTSWNVVMTVRFM